MQKRLVIAVALSIFILLLFQRLQPPVERNEQLVTEKPAAIVDKMATVETGEPEFEEVNFKEHITESIYNDLLRIEVSPVDSGISGLFIKDKDGSMINLVRKEEPPFPLGLEAAGFKNWKLSKININEILAVSDFNGVRLERIYKLNDIIKRSDTINSIPYAESVIVIRTKIINETDSEKNINLKQGWFNGLGTTEKLKKENYNENKPFMRINNKVRKNAEKGIYEGALDWAGILNRYFVVINLQIDKIFSRIVIDRENKKSPGCGRGSGEGLKYPSLILEGEAVISPHGYYEFEDKIYAGLKEYKKLTELNNFLGEIFAFGFFGFLSKLFLNVLIWLNLILGNYGAAIIIMTLILQIVIFPLTVKSFKSMSAMKELQPKITTMKAKFKNDPQRMNKEMMQLYKRHKVNPMGGCLPMLMQMPIFISLFTMLRSAAELRFAAFLWIKDLSGADVLFSYIPVIKEIPLLGGGGPLPILMGLAMFLQQKFMGSAEGPQKSLMYMMPIVFTFMFMGFPSGLVLYWLSNSIFTFIVQYILSKRR